MDNDSYTDKYVNRDWKNTIDTAVSKAKSEGREAGLVEGEQNKQKEIARSMKADALPIETIARYTGLSPEEIIVL